MTNPYFYLLVGMIACFIGTIPFGPINLTVVKTTVDHNRLRGTEVALAASLIEILQALIAISFGMVISSYLESNVVIKIILACFLLGVFAGKLIALYGFVIASDYLKSHLQKSSKMVNRLLAGILLLIGLSQALSAITKFTS